MKSLTPILITLIITGCANQPETKAEVIEEEVEVVAINPNQLDRAIYSIDYNTRPKDIISYEQGYRHIVTDHVIDRSPENSAVVDPKIIMSSIEKTVQTAIGREKPPVVPVKTTHRNDNLKNDVLAAWVAHCMHEPMTEYEEQLVDTSTMPEFLVEKCIPDK